jgi:hypothetical protein
MLHKLWVEDRTTETKYPPSRVPIAGCDYVDELLEEIKRKFELHLPVSKLILFQPNGITPIDVGESPSIYLLGNSRSTPLVVKAVVVALPATQIQQLTACGLPFYNRLHTVAEEAKWLSFGEAIPSSTLTRLLVRESYQSIASRIQPGVSKAVITGTPGIGKSLFLIYLLWKLVKTSQRVLFIHHPDTIYYDGTGGVFELDNLPSVIDHAFWTSDLWCLFDAKCKKEEHLIAIPFERCAFVLSTLPRREMINDFQKPPEPQVYYMPLWTETELCAIAPLFPRATQWRERFEFLGGIPRHVLEATTKTPTEILELACTDCSLDDCIKKIGLNSAITEKSMVVHSLVHIESDPPYTNASVCYASPAALRIIVRNKGDEAKLRMRNLLASCEGNSLTAALCGYIFEPFAYELLEKGGTFTHRRLVHGNKKDKPSETELIISSSERQVVEGILPNQTRNQLYVPAVKNHKAIDAWIPGVGAFQMTVGKTHDIKGDLAKDLALLGQGADKLYWLLPPLHYSKFTKKALLEIDQYAVLIPYPPV